ncbi:hypothetical protein ACIBKY_51990 [Nonomuraea sp. NPDC050394]|uniref:hypothetical protein n=1 Tax=Nonomuraea sp. NPDC050394 TaxID=3364363 RepID=UPI0037A825D6
MSLSDWIVSWLRTNVAAWIPTLAAWLAGFGIELPVEAGTLAVGSLLVSGYYTLARLLESVWPAAGVLLGWRAAPSYSRGQVAAGYHPGAHSDRDLRGM